MCSTFAAAQQKKVEQVHFCELKPVEEPLQGFTKPSFPGGNDSMLAWLKRELPDSVRAVCGKFMVRVTVDTLGKIQFIQLYLPADNLHILEIMVVFFEMPCWNPAVFVNKQGVARRQEWSMGVQVEF
ncbi:MAG: hypothetical protein MUC87_01110 [Bacteroidia bacterium]|nr:hypothetical protein [Bacteroidia bacterium]